MGVSWVNTDYTATDVIINKDPGVYILGHLSSEGKTWLCNTLKEMRLHEARVIGYSYDDYSFGTKLKDLLDAMPDCQVLMLDRYDMYKGPNCNNLEDEIKSVMGHCIVLIDCKSFYRFKFLVGYAVISLNSSLEIEVN